MQASCSCMRHITACCSERLRHGKLIVRAESTTELQRNLIQPCSCAIQLRGHTSPYPAATFQPIQSKHCAKNVELYITCAVEAGVLYSPAYLSQ